MDNRYVTFKVRTTRFSETSLVAVADSKGTINRTALSSIPPEILLALGLDHLPEVALRLKDQATEPLPPRPLKTPQALRLKVLLLARR